MKPPDQPILNFSADEAFLADAFRFNNGKEFFNARERGEQRGGGNKIV